MAHWVTPAASMDDGTQTALGEVNYGIESRMFIFAYRDADAHTIVTDTSMPSYNNIVALTPSEKGIYADSKYLISEPNTKPERDTTEVPLFVTNEGVSLDTGLRIASNGQIVGRLRISDAAKEIIFKIGYTDPPEYNIGIKYRAYTTVHYNSRLYRLKSSATLPFFATDGAPADASWEDIGAYKPQFSKNSTTQIFRIIINARSSTLITFDDLDTLDLKIGEQLGDAKIADFKASSSFGLSYELLLRDKNKLGVDAVLDADGTYHQFPKGLHFEADGTVSGHAVGPVGTYTFDIIANSTNGLSKQSTATLVVKPGFEPYTIAARLAPSQHVEREWYEMISNTAFSNIQLYRPSDPNYGLVDFPSVMLKRNLACKYLNTGVDFNILSSLISDKLPTQLAVPVRVGNMKYRTALDKDGAPLYEIIFKELVPISAGIQYTPDPLQQTPETVADIIALKQRLTTLLGSDDLSVQSDKLRGYPVHTDPLTYDDLPLWMTNIDKANGATEGIYYAMPVAFVLPGEAQKFIDLAIEYGVLPTMYFNKIVELDRLILTQQTSETSKEVIVPLRRV